MVFCESHGIAVEGYSPLTKAYRLSDPVFVDMAEVYGKTVPQVNPCGPCVALVWPLWMSGYAHLLACHNGHDDCRS